MTDETITNYKLFWNHLLSQMQLRLNDGASILQAELVAIIEAIYIYI